MRCQEHRCIPANAEAINVATISFLKVLKNARAVSRGGGLAMSKDEEEFLLSKGSQNNRGQQQVARQLKLVLEEEAWQPWQR